MKQQFIRSTSGWIPVSVLLLLIIALVAGQAEANLPSHLRSGPAEHGAVHGNVPTTITLERAALRETNTMPFVVDAFLMLTLKMLSAQESDAGRIDSGHMDNADRNIE